jgi:hypothetical protein
MSKLKKIITGFLFFAIALTLTGCGSSENSVLEVEADDNLVKEEYCDEDKDVCQTAYSYYIKGSVKNITGSAMLNVGGIVKGYDKNGNKTDEINISNQLSALFPGFPQNFEASWIWTDKSKAIYSYTVEFINNETGELIPFN